MTVRFDVYTDPTTKEKTAFNVETYRKGIIVVKETDKGFVQDPNFGQIPLFEPMMNKVGAIINMCIKFTHGFLPDDNFIYILYPWYKKMITANAKRIG